MLDLRGELRRNTDVGEALSEEELLAVLEQEIDLKNRTDPGSLE